jgi:hypothetical protein
MLSSTGKTNYWRAAAGATMLFASLLSTGCQVDVGGQTLPSAYWHQDDVFYAAPGPDMKVAREAAAQEAYRAEQLRAAKKSDSTRYR